MLSSHILKYFKICSLRSSCSRLQALVILRLSFEEVSRVALIHLKVYRHHPPLPPWPCVLLLPVPFHKIFLLVDRRLQTELHPWFYFKTFSPMASIP